MSKRIYYNVPCTLFRDYLKDAMHRKRIFDDVLVYAIYAEFMRLQDEETDKAKRFDKACKNMGCMAYKMNDVLSQGAKLYASGKGEAYCSIEADKFWQQVNEQQTDEERALFLAWVALKSIIGNKPYIKTNNALWLSRMDGNSKKKERGFKHKHTYTEAVERYNSLYKCRRLRALLFEYYHVSFFSDGVRGFYFSLTLDMERLLRAVKESTRTNAISKYNEAKKAALEALNHDCNHNCNHDLNHNCNLK